MARVDIDWHGDEIEHLTDTAVERAVRRGLQPIADASQDRVLVQTGDLKRSQRVVAEGNVGAVTYLDSKAVGAHENLAVSPNRRRNPNASAKFLEAAVHEKRDEALREIADALRDVL